MGILRTGLKTRIRTQILCNKERKANGHNVDLLERCNCGVVRFLFAMVTFLRESADLVGLLLDNRLQSVAYVVQTFPSSVRELLDTMTAQSLS